NKLADTKIHVMPALRWQVFQRDHWRCLSCGRTTEDGIILHVDHIIPRSKGGQDHLDNYQTLCEMCNIGKSNKDQTNLRNR
ncbi:MAG TPA: HNH endonuclease, partial [Segetibacter sp.]|nr:HNH endonuclease [Segetibacter sp.]